MGVASKTSTDNHVDMATYRRVKIGPLEAAECRPINDAFGRQFMILEIVENFTG